MSFVQIEKQHLQLLHFLDSSHSGKVKLSHLVVFLKQLIQELHKSQTDSYFLELWPILADYIQLPHLSGMDLQFLGDLQDILVFYRDEISTDDYQKFERVLEKAQLSAALILGDEETLSRILSQFEKDVPAGIIKDIRKEKTPFDRLNAWIQNIQKKTIRDDYKDIECIWQDYFGGYSSNQLLCLLVETDSEHTFLSGQAHFYPVRLKVRENDKEVTADTVHFFNHLKRDIHQKQKLEEIIHTAKSMLRERGFKKASEKHYSFEFSLLEKTAVYEGGSWNAGLLVLSYCGMIEAYYSRPFIRKNNAIILIGDLDKEGNLLPVDEEGLKAKIEAAFFAPVTELIIPNLNLQAAELALADLKKRYPNRTLQLFPISSVNEIHDIPQLFQPARRLGIRKAAGLWLRSVKRKPVIWGAGAVAVLISLLIMISNILFFDQNPVQFQIDDRYIHFLNKEKNILWSHAFQKIVSSEYVIPFRSRILLSDLDDDQKNEVLLGTLNRDHPEDSGDLFFYDHDGSVIWKFHASYQQSSSNYTYIDHYRIYNIKLQDVLNTGLPQIITEIAHSPYYPSNLSMFDMEGNVLGEYWHSGRFLPIDFHDLNGDSILEIFVGGTNNLFRTAFLCVLDPRNMTGKSPDYPLQIKDRDHLQEGIEICYIRFPKSPFCRDTWRDTMTAIKFEKDRFIVIISNQFVSDGRRKIPECSILSYEFNYQFELLNLDLHDQFIRKHSLTFGRVPSEEEVQALHQIEYLHKTN